MENYKNSLVIKNAKIFKVNANKNDLIDANIFVKDGLVSQIDLTRTTDIKGFDVFEAKGKLIMPGFFNIHAHSPMSIMRGYGEGLSLQDWLFTRIFPFEERLDGETVYQATLLTIAEGLRYGIVSTTDMYFFAEDMVRAYIDSGAKVNISRALTSDEEEDISKLKSFIEAKSLFEAYHGSENGRILVDMALHAEYTSTPEIAKQLAEFTKSVGTNMHLHASETKREHIECKEKFDKTPVEYFVDLGLLDRPTTVAHGVWLEEGDMQLLAEKNATLAHCPVSNMKLASGIADIDQIKNYGVNIGLGTDGLASNNSLAFIEEMKAMALLAKLKHLDPIGLDPSFILDAATINGAKSQGRADTGALEVGKKADLIALDIKDISLIPSYELSTNLVYALPSTAVDMTMVDGKILYENGEWKTIDVEKLGSDVVSAAKRIADGQKLP